MPTETGKGRSPLRNDAGRLSRSSLEFRPPPPGDGTGRWSDGRRV